MRAVILLFLLIISICHRLGLSEEQTNLERSRSKPSYKTTNNRVKSLGQREVYIPSYSASQQKRSQYIKNVENAYQYQYPHKLQRILSQRSPTYLFRKPIYKKYVDSYDYSEYNSDSQKENKSTNQKLKAVDDVLREQRNIKEVGNDYEYDNKMLKHVIRRKGSTNDNVIHSSALQSDEERNIPIALAHEQQTNDNQRDRYFGDFYFVVLVACVSAVAIFGVIGAGYCVYKVQQSNKAAADVDYPAYGVVGPASKDTNSNGNLSPIGDRKLAQSAQMYHYHHQKQQMIASEKAVTTRHTSASDNESDEENEEGEYTVYECPGLAPTGEMEVKNPLFHDDITPVSSPPVNANNKDK